MAVNVYSKVLTKLAGCAAGHNTLGGPPAGHKWIVKDICCSFGGGFMYPREGFRVIDFAGIPLLEVRRPLSVTGYTFHSALSQVVEETDELIIDCGEAGWSVRVSGYELVLP